MATLPTQGFTTIVANTIAGIQGRASKLINFSTGSTLRAIVEGFAGTFLWFQGIVLKLLQATRLSTSSGVDVDTFVADFMPTVGVSNGVQSPRLGAESATGRLTFSRFTAAPSTVFIPAASAVTAAGVITNAGPSNAAQAQSNDGSQAYVVMADPTNANYSASLGGFTLPADTVSISVAAQALLAGSAGNVAANTITVMTTPLAGMDTVTNVAAFNNGADFESDSALKTRFADYILGLARGDYYGLQSSIKGTEVTVQWTLTEMYNFDGSYRPGYFLVIADDGSGTPPASFLSLVTNAAFAVRPLGIQCSVLPPTILTATVSMQISTAVGYDHNQVVAQVAATVADNINAMGLGNPLPYSILAAWAYSVAGVTSVQAVLLNGQSGDSATLLTTKPTLDGKNTINYMTIKAGSVLVS